MSFTLSNQAVGAIMMALQKSLMEQSDIVPILTGFELQIDDSNQLVMISLSESEDFNINPIDIKIFKP